VGLGQVSQRGDSRHRVYPTLVPVKYKPTKPTSRYHALDGHGAIDDRPARGLACGWIDRAWSFDAAGMASKNGEAVSDGLDSDSRLALP